MVRKPAPDGRVYKKGEGRLHLFYETTHSPSLIELVGVDEARRIIDFCFIANHYYPTRAMIRKMQDRFVDLIKSYPGSARGQGEKHLSKVIGVKAEHLLVGNGATEIIALVMDHLIRKIAVAVPTFSEYVQHLRARAVSKLYHLRADQDYLLDLDAYLEWVQKNRLKAVLVINPGNPTGQTFDVRAMKRFLRKAAFLDLVIVDESFIDFAGTPIPSLLPHMREFSNLLVIRSMSKHCGVPGLRLGYAASGNLDTINVLRSYMAVWNVNTLAEYFLSLLPATAEQYEAARVKVIDDTQWLVRQLGCIPALKVYPTGASFILVRVPDGVTAWQVQMDLLHDHRMYVRDCANKVGMDTQHLRIASQGRAKDRQLVQVLKNMYPVP
jgi:histidinol-phosphate/aromatic aminotransferase/cobyric acid decarboxylase-like protein